MRSALAELTRARALLSHRGRRTLTVYGLSLTVLSGLDAVALVLVSRLFMGNDAVISADFSLFGMVIVLFITRTGLSTCVSWWAVRVLADEEVRIGTKNLSLLVDRDMADRLSEADYYNAVDRGPSNLTQGLMMYSVTIASEIATALVILGTLVVLDFPTAVSSTVYFLGIAYIQNKWLSRSAARAGGTATEQTGIVYETLLDGFKLRKILRVMPSRSFETSLQSRRTLLASSRARIAFLGMLPRYTMELVLSIGLVVVCGVAYLVNGDQGAIEAVAIFGVAGFRLLPSINRIQGLILLLFSAVPTARLSHLEPTTSGARAFGTEPPHNDEILVFENVTFRYPDAQTDAIHRVSIAFEEGLQYAILGPSGAGKTTFLDLLLGLLHPGTGAIRRRPNLTVGYVPQDTHLARASFGENVALEWDPNNVDSNLLSRVLDMTALHQVADRFGPDGSHRMSDNVASGGQRQRIGLARALYREPSLLVLDEVTSALDTETENFVMQHVQSLHGRATVIIVAHRLTTVQNADKVIYIEDGVVLGIGTFEELRQSLPQLRRQIELGTLNLDS
jgi:ABC-type multidrug transport system fused ATPase/permease subunit